MSATMSSKALLVVASLFASSPANSDRETSPFDLGVPANQTCAVLWDEEEGALSRHALAEEGKVVLRIPDSEEARKLLPELAGRSVELDLDGLHRLPLGMTPENTIVLGTYAEGGTAYAPYFLYTELVGCLPCPSLSSF